MKLPSPTATLALLTTVFALMGAKPAFAESRTVCAYDPGGKSGEYHKLLEDFALEATAWGVEIEIKAYTDEETAAKDYEAGKCDGVVATGVRLQRFNRFSSTIEGIGAISDYKILQQLVDSFVKYPSAAQKLRSGEHEVVGVFPAGLVYLFVRDRNIDTAAELAGKRIATMDYDKAAPVMVDRVGAIMVPADLGSIGPKFNNGNVDAAYISAPAYQPFEMWRGLEPSGGIIRFPLAMATFQLMIRHDRFPEDFGAKARAALAGRFDEAKAAVLKTESAIPAKYWIDIPADDQRGYEDLFLQTRLDLRDKHGAYDATMLSVLRKLRCANDGGRAECVEKKE